MNIIKRNGEETAFNKAKIAAAIGKANKTVKAEEQLAREKIEAIADAIEQFALAQEMPLSVEDIQNMVETKIQEAGAYHVAKHYIKYRYEREIARNEKALMEKLTASNVQNQNANVDEQSFGGRMGETLSLVAKKYALEHVISKKAARNHNNNEIYIHDLDSYAVGMHNCAERHMWVKIMQDDMPQLVRIGELADRIGVGYNQIADTSRSNLYILSRDGWTKLLNISKRKLRKLEKLYTIRTRTGIPVKVTEDHLLPIIRNGKEILVKAREIKVGDSLLDIESIKLSSEEYQDCFLNLTTLNDSDVDIRVVNLSPIRHYVRYKYGIVFLDYIKSKGFKMQSNGRYGQTLTLPEFNRLCDDYPLSFDVLSDIRIKGCGSKHSYPLHIPYSVDLAKLYGYIYGDGGVYIRKDKSQYQLTFTNTDMTIMEDFVKCYENVFGYRLKIYAPSEKSTSPCFRVVDGSLIPCKIFKDFAGARKYGADDISIPDFIMNGEENIKYGFIASAIDTDGWVGERKVTYTTSGDKYAEQMMLLLRSLGFHPSKIKSFSKGSVYRFGRKSGIRNFDVYNINLYRSDEVSRLIEKIDSFKGKDKISHKGLSHKFNENKVYSITSTIGDYDVFDVETDSHWFILNNYVSHNCLSIPFDKLLAEGFNTRQCDVRPAGSINTAMQLVAVIFQLQSLQQFGGVSATHLDWTMVPYVRLSFWKHYWDGIYYIVGDADRAEMTKEQIREISIDSSIYNKGSKAYTYATEMTYNELKQAVEGLYHNLNTLQSRSGCQLPFTSINYGTCTLPEGRIVINALLEGSIKGVGKFHKTPIFPCGIFQCMKGVNRKQGDPNYDLFKLALKSTALRLYPNYASVDWSANAGYDKENPCTYFSTMGCRTANLADINADDPKLVQLKDGRGNICPVTCILPTYAMKAKKKADSESAKEKKNGNEWDDTQKERRRLEIFFEILDKKIGEAKDMLLERFEWICSQSPKSARFMYENGTMYGYKPEEGIRSALKHGTLAIGQLGLAETLQILIGCDHTTAKGMRVAKKIEQLFKDKCAAYKKEYKLNFGVYYTPAENLCYTAMKKFKEKYGEIPNVSDRDYFTNSIHVPVWHKMTPFEKIDIESQLTGYSSAGCITYVELDSSTQNNTEALEELVNYAMDKDIPYFAVNVPNDCCSDCGYTDDIGESCPKCGSKNIQRLRRVTGYLTGSYKEAFNLGKQHETEDRVKHNGIEA